MNEQVARVLAQLVATYGRELCEDPRRCRALLSDHCPQMRREINVLVAALEEGVAEEWLRSSAGVPWEALAGRLTRRLTDNRAIAAPAARWGVEAWGAALGLLPTRDPVGPLALEPSRPPAVEPAAHPEQALGAPPVAATPPVAPRGAVTTITVGGRSPLLESRDWAILRVVLVGLVVFGVAMMRTAVTSSNSTAATVLTATTIPMAARATTPSASQAPGGGWATTTGNQRRAAGPTGKMVRVPAGRFFMGCNEAVDSDCFSDEKPGRKLDVSAFQIDRTEVTATAYQACVAAGLCMAPASGGGCNWEVTGHETHPVNCVNWDQARAYCEWAGKRLPTEAEWEKAARGTDGRKYPWGNGAVGAGRANLESGAPQAVGRYPAGASPYGALDMAGNVGEWVADQYPGTEGRVVRGGGWFYAPRLARASYRGRYDPRVRVNFIGFRCAQ